MKRLLGADGFGKYAFNPTAKTIALSEIPILAKGQLLIVVNTTTGGMIYNFADPTNYGGTFTENVLTFNVSASGMATTDALTIVVEVDNRLVGLATERGEPLTSDTGANGLLVDMLCELRRIRLGIESLADVDLSD